MLRHVWDRLNSASSGSTLAQAIDARLRRIHSTQPMRSSVRLYDGETSISSQSPRHRRSYIELTRSDIKFPAGCIARLFLIHQSNFYLVPPRAYFFSGEIITDGGAGGRLIWSKSKRKHQNRFSRSYFCRVFTAELLRVFGNRIPSAWSWSFPNLRFELERGRLEEATCGCVPVPLRKRTVPRRIRGWNMYSLTTFSLPIQILN